MRSNCKAFSQLVIKGERPLVGGTISGLVVLGSIREQAEQARGTKPVKILGGVKVEDNVVIGANGVVVKDVPANTIVAGVPAYIIRKNGEKVYEKL